MAHIVKLLKLGFGVTSDELMNIMQELMTELRAANPKRKCKWDENLPPYHFAQSNKTSEPFQLIGTSFFIYFLFLLFLNKYFLSM